MSTMLKTAAMGLLSRTLQSFLHKYLLEVDVEGVAMPSLMDVDGHSGWGVRLCNVKLREGVELMTLPGKRKVKKRRKKKVAKNRTDPESAQGLRKSNTVVDEDTRHMNGSTFSQHHHVQNGDVNEQQQQRQGKGAAAAAADDDDNNDLNASDDYARLVAVTSRGSNITPIRSRMMTEDDTDMESALSSRVPSPSIMCRTSVASAVTGCLSRSHTNVESTTDDEHDDDEVQTPNALPSRPTQHDSLVKHDVVFDTKALEGENTVVEPKALFRPIQPDDKEKRNSEKKRQSTQAEPVVETVDDDSDSDDEGEEEQGEDEFYYVEEDMVLCLGKAGRIGTLDVRLIGKELHIMVEDAFLTIEACPKAEDVSDDASVRTASTADTTKDDAASKAAAKKKESKKKAPSTKSSEGETAGERVMKASILAKAISAIPHLLLRDVRVQFIVRNKAQESEGEVQADVSSEDTVVELGIEMLSVTSGEDILENFGKDDSKSGEMEDSASNNTSSRKRLSLQVLEERDENEYLMKRIRTGKGPEGGITIKVFPPNINKRRIASRVEEKPDWAYQRYFSRAQYCLLRCSGLDIRTRIYLGKQKEVALRNNDYAWYGDEYDEYTIDSMLFGVDYIAPAPPPLPPLKEPERFPIDPKIKPEVERFVQDENGIQSNSVPSCFHKVARGLTPSLCQKDHLPSDYCTYCWENSARPNSYSEHPLDSRTPLPGIVFHLALNEPLEINVDRQSLELIGDLQELFGIHLEDLAATEPEGKEEESKPEKTSITQRLKRMTTFAKKEKKAESLRSSFPSYMKPETIEIVGFNVAQIVLRVHVLRKESIYDQGLGFRYWEASLRCATVDIQLHMSKEKEFQDIRVDLGHFITHDFVGVEKKKVLSLGLPQPEVDDSDSVSVSSYSTTSKKPKGRACWPNTAAVLLQVPPLADIADFESRERHGAQIRFFSLGGNDSDLLRTTLNGRLGVLYAEFPDTFPEESCTMINEMTRAVLIAKDEKSIDSPPASGSGTSVKRKAVHPPSLMKYAVRLDGGQFLWSPLVSVRLPILRLGGEQSSDNQEFFETILNHVKIQYGKRSMLEKPQSQLSLSHMAHLPDDVRMRILLCLKDMGPLEKALGIKRESNSFLRTRSVNKAIVKVARRSSSLTKAAKRKKSHKLPHDPRPSRQEILNELMKLDEQALYDIWMSQKGRSSRPKGLNARKRPSADK